MMLGTTWPQLGSGKAGNPIPVARRVAGTWLLEPAVLLPGSGLAGSSALQDLCQGELRLKPQMSIVEFRCLSCRAKCLTMGLFIVCKVTRLCCECNGT